MNQELVGKTIAYLRKSAGLTQNDLANRIGISDKAVSKWERGLSMPDISCLNKLSIILDTDTDSLLSGNIGHHKNNWRGLLIIDESNSFIKPDTLVYDKPMVYFLLSYFILVGINNIHIICSEDNKKRIEKLLGDGAKYGINLIFSTDNLYNCENIMIIYKNIFLYGVDQTRFFQKAMHETNHFTILSLAGTKADENNIISFNKDKKIISNNKNDVIQTQYLHTKLPILFCPTKKLVKKNKKIFEICSLIKILLERNELYTEILDRGFIEIEIDSQEKLLDASNLVNTIQRISNYKIYDLEEIAWRRGLIKNN